MSDTDFYKRMYCYDRDIDFYYRCAHLSERTVLKFRNQKLFIIYGKKMKKSLLNSSFYSTAYMGIGKLGVIVCI